jgi:hypothetical protein
MAQQGSGLGSGPDPKMKDRVTSSPIDPRSGTAKHPQTTFANTFGMKDMTTLSGVSPATPGSGPDASSPNPLGPEPLAKILRKQPLTLKANPGTPVDGDGDGLDEDIGGKVIGEAILSGSTAFPASTSEK